MQPRKTTDFGALFDMLTEDLRMQVAASVERTLGEFNRRLARIERRLDQLDPSNAVEAPAPARICSVCERAAMARGLCSAHYQQWRYRERKSKLTRQTPPVAADVTSLGLSAPIPIARDN
jgi:hypothetical protein